MLLTNFALEYFFKFQRKNIFGQFIVKITANFQEKLTFQFTYWETIWIELIVTSN